MDRAIRIILKFLIDNPDGGSISHIREAIASNRKSCLIIVNYCDKQGYVFRNGDTRTIGDSGKKYLTS